MTNRRTNLSLAPEVVAALAAGSPVVALESTLISHGLPWPINLETARASEDAVRAAGAVPATVAVLAGVPTVGLSPAELERLALEPGVRKASTRDLAAAVAQGATAATTVAATMSLAHRAGIRIFATGGIGGVHRGRIPGPSQWDVSADLGELARTPVAVVCAGAKSLLDLPATLEVLETNGVPVLGYGTDTFPAFYVRDSGLPVSCRVDSPTATAAVLRAHWALGQAGVVVARPLEADLALSAEDFEVAYARAEADAVREGVRGPRLTPFLLARLADLTAARANPACWAGKPGLVSANRALIVANARLAGDVARALAEGGE